MCGLTAIFQFSPGLVSDAVLQTMTSALTHRGPDDCGYYLDEWVGLGHRRLAIIDPDGGKQPVFNETGDICVVYNGEIYNHIELRKQLESRGHIFSSRSDSEVLVHAWEEWGIDALNYLRGMFAFVLWDKAKKQLLVARDRLGIKPLYWAKTLDNRWVFASELKALYLYPDMDWTINSRAIEDYFSLGYIPEPKTVYKHIHKLEPGHYFLIDTQVPDAVIEPQCYWDPLQCLDQNAQEISPQQVFDKLKESVGLHMLADVPVGAFLSGGLDSSAIVALMNELATHRVQTCAIGFDHPRYDETQQAQRVAKQFATEHQSLRLGYQSIELVDELVATYDEPFADNSAIPTYLLSRLARDKVKVVLSGDGSDELFVGYRNYKMLQFEERMKRYLPRWFRRHVLPSLSRAYPKLDWAPRWLRAKTTLKALSNSAVDNFHHAACISDRECLDKLYSNEFHQQLAGYESLSLFRRLSEQVPELDAVKMAQYIDLKTYLPGDILTKLDRATMAHSLEARVPFLDHELVAFCINQPTAKNIHCGKLKYTLTIALKGILPEFVLKRVKMGFTSPLDEWFRALPRTCLCERLLSTNMRESGYFTAEYITLLIDEHRSKKRNHGPLLWALLIFDGFLKQHKQRSLLANKDSPNDLQKN